jgi:hypothetical protein
MNVADPRGPQLFRQGHPVELRVVSRSGDAAYVDDALNAVRPQKIEECFSGAGRMPNGQDIGHFLRFHMNQVLRSASLMSESSSAAS